jgi:hypothetical protein
MDAREYEQLEHEMVDRILIVSEAVWEGRVSNVDIYEWLNNFTGEVKNQSAERLNALHLLSQFCFFGQRELRVLLRAQYRDLFQNPFIQSLRPLLGPAFSVETVQAAYSERLRRTRFLGMGNPSESGSHLLYYFRQENQLHRDLFVHQHELFTGPASNPDTRLMDTNLQHIVFIDDLLGSGQQAEAYGQSILKDIRDVANRSGATIRISYLVLFAKEGGLRYARSLPGGFDEILAVHELDHTQNAFDIASRVYQGVANPISRETGQEVAHHYGNRLFPGNPLGYRDGQMLLGLHHNVPDNTLPIFWNNERVQNWATTFVRYPKDVLWA